MTVKKVCFFVVVVYDDFFSLSLLKCSSNFPEVNKKTSPQESQKTFALFPNLTYRLAVFRAEDASTSVSTQQLLKLRYS